MNKARVLYSAALLLFMLGLFVTYRALESTPQMKARMDRKLNDLRDLRHLAVQGQDVMGLLQKFEELGARLPRPLAEIADEAGVPRPTTRRRDAKPAAGGWNLVTMTATFEDIPLANLSAFIREAGQVKGNPPWRLAECSINALDQGRGRAVLVLEALEKPGP